MLTNKIVKYLFYRYNDFFLLKSSQIIFLMHTKLTQNKVVLEELLNRHWQYLIKTLISSIENKKSNCLTLLEKKETKIIKDMKENCKVIQRDYNSIMQPLLNSLKFT